MCVHAIGRQARIGLLRQYTTAMPLVSFARQHCCSKPSASIHLHDAAVAVSKLRLLQHLVKHMQGHGSNPSVPSAKARYISSAHPDCYHHMHDITLMTGQILPWHQVACTVLQQVQDSVLIAAGSIESCSISASCQGWCGRHCFHWLHSACSIISVSQIDEQGQRLIILLPSMPADSAACRPCTLRTDQTW